MQQGVGESGGGGEAGGEKKDEAVPSQLRALLWQHFCYYRNRWWLALLTVLLPVLFFCVAFAMFWYLGSLRKYWTHPVMSEDPRIRLYRPTSTSSPSTPSPSTDLFPLGPDKERHRGDWSSTCPGLVLHTPEASSETAAGRVLGELGGVLREALPHCRESLLRGFPSLHHLKAAAPRLLAEQERRSKKIEAARQSRDSAHRVELEEFQLLGDPILGGVVIDEGSSLKDFRYALLHLRNVVEGGPSSTKSRRMTQMLVDAALLRATSPKAFRDHTPVLDVLPGGCREENNYFLVSMTIYLVFLANLSAYFLPRAHFLSQVLTEKELKLREYLYINGVGDLRLKLSWALFYGLAMLPVAFVATLFLRFAAQPSLFGKTEAGLVLITQLLFVSASLAHVYLVAAVFQTPKGSTSFLGVLDFILAFLALGMFSQLDFLDAELPVAVVLSLVYPAVPFALAHVYLVRWEAASVGGRWSLLFHSPNPYNLNGYGGLGVAWLLLIVDTFLYVALAWYFERVFPGEFGVARKPWFPFLPSFWRGTDAEAAGKEESVGGAEEGRAPRSDRGPVGVELLRLTKKFGPGKFGVRDLNLRFYQNLVTVFLGQNGAGKSTAMNILVGLTTATSGKALVMGKDVGKDTSAVRKLVGFVPQYDILYPRMSVRQHLKFFGWLKGASWARTEREVQPLLLALGMLHLLDTQTTKLSGGQKRKLSVMTAFLGSPKVVILDEPTSGVDPASRRAIWELVQARRASATIILSTHFMDEADLLGDHVNIISSGKEVAWGTPMELKSKYGQGFRLTLALSPGRAAAALEGLKAFLGERTSGGRVLSQQGSDLTYSLSRDFARSPAMGRFLEELEEAQGRLAVDSFGLSEPSMDEVFFASVDQALKDRPKDAGPEQAKEAAPEEPIQDSDPEELKAIKAAVTSDQLQFQLMPSSLAQLVGLGYKKLLYTVRSPLFWFAQIFLPFCLTLLGIVLGQKVTSQMDRDAAVPLGLDLGYRQSLAFLQADAELWKVDGGLVGKYAESLLNGGLPPDCPGDADCAAGDAAWSTGDIDPINLDPARTSTCPRPAQPLGPGEETPARVTLRQVAEVRERLPHARLASGAELYRLGRRYYLPDFLYQVSSDTEQVVAGLDLGRGTSPELKVWQGFGAWGSVEAAVAQAAALNLYANLELRRLSGDEAARVRIGAVFTDALQTKQAGVVDNLPNILILSFVCCGLIAAMGASGGVMMDELESGQKRFQMLSGALPWVYWSVSLAVDAAFFLLTTASLALPVLFMSSPLKDQLGFLVLTTAVYGAQSLSFVYLSTFLLRTNRGLQIFLVCTASFLFQVGFVIGLANGAMLALCSGANGNDDYLCDTKMTMDLIGVLTRLHPIGFFSETIFAGSVLFSHQVAGRPGVPGLYDWPVLGVRAAESVVLTLLQLAGVTALEWLDVRCRGCGCCQAQTGPVTAAPVGGMDADVAAEKQRVAAGQTGAEPLVVRELWKCFPGALYPAVSGISLGVPAGQCFGLLGINGAGKTTTFNMLTGALRPDFGEARLNGKDLAKGCGLARFAGASYCPQENTVFLGLTARQSLRLIFRLRGVPSAYWAKLERLLISECGLAEHADKHSASLSGGNKRKLNLAMCLVGYLPVMFLDEPTTGMDPGARRAAWECVKRATGRGCAVVLTSHSMEECEALCHRLTIMVAGTFQCLGSVQYLKGKYGQEYNFKIKLAAGVVDTKPLKDLVGKELPKARLAEEHSKTLFYEVPAAAVRLSQLFRFLQGLKTSAPVPVEDFAVSQTSLEHVFLRMALVQEQIQAQLLGGPAPQALPAAPPGPPPPTAPVPPATPAKQPAEAKPTEAGPAEPKAGEKPEEKAPEASRTAEDLPTQPNDASPLSHPGTTNRSTQPDPVESMSDTDAKTESSRATSEASAATAADFPDQPPDDDDKPTSPDHDQ